LVLVTLLATPAPVARIKPYPTGIEAGAKLYLLGGKTTVRYFDNVVITETGD